MVVVILINVKFKPLPEYVDTFREQVAEFTEKTRAEEGNIFFDWSINTDNPNEFILIEAFQDDAAEAHVNSDHFKRAMAEMPQALASTPKIISQQIDATDWSLMGELTVD